MDMSPAGTGRMIVALVVIGLAALSAFLTMDPGSIRIVTLGALTFFALRVVFLRRRSR
jgi:hypothetical protein